MILHTPLTVTERHRHDFDPFPDYRRRIQERNHRFVRIFGEVYRENELWRITTDSEISKIISEELLFRNSSEVLYDTSTIPGIEVIELS